MSRPFISLAIGIASLVCAASAFGADLSHYDCSGLMGGNGPAGHAVYQYRSGALHAYERFRNDDGSLLCLKEVRPEIHWLDAVQAAAELLQMQPRPVPYAGQILTRTPAAESEIRLARPKPLPKASAPNAAPKAAEEAMPAPLAQDNDQERRPTQWFRQFASGATTTASGDTRMRVPDTSALPFATVAYIGITFPSQNVFSCTATLVTPYVALTAGHCVYDVSEGGYATRIRLSPGMQQTSFGGAVTFPFGNRLADSWQTTTQWQNEPSGDTHPSTDYEYDTAVIFFSAPFSAFTNSSSFMPVAFSQSPSSVSTDGYPGQVQGQDNSGPWKDTEKVDTTTPSQDALLLTTEIYSSPGDSGSPFWTSIGGINSMVGSLSAGPSSGPGAIGPKYGPQVRSLVSSWLSYVPPNQPETGWWWNASTPGRGFAMEVSKTTGNIFFSAFQYDPFTARDQWTVATLSPTGVNGQFAGPLTLYSANGTTGSLGTLTLTMSNPVTGVLTWPASVGGGTTSITRYPVDPTGNGQLFGADYGYGAQRGWWWNPSQPGRGYVLEIQNDYLFFGAFIYHSDGTAAWMVASGEMTSTNTFTATAYEYQNGTTYAQGARTPASTPSGTVQIQFNSNNTSGTLTMGGQSIPIQRFNSF